MRAMLPWAAILVIGILIVALVPMLSDAPAVDAETPGVYPQWIVPVGYFTALIGAGGLAVSFFRRYGRS
ncbi:hypothetical protein E2L08_01425 [Palleronia sediminis]|uniref:Uncharacterized protein n=1 Tax=Palleronia sediminis TaxID=2547833 RepID=A0A4R6ANK6_9RHOB|nr:hypothetical protein [Palleronia sediminis]TDL84158.1 hypothetical protein E2L08_01425 [Palleronia sediminis]